MISVCPVEPRLDPVGQMLLSSFGTSGPASDVTTVRMSDSSIPPRIVAPLKKCVGSNVFPMTVGELVLDRLAAARRLGGDGTHDAREALDRHARRRERAERVALRLVAELEAERRHGFQEDLARVLARGRAESLVLVPLRVFDLGHRIRLLEQPLDGGDADVRAFHLRVELRLRQRDARSPVPTAKVMSDVGRRGSPSDPALIGA